MALESIHGAEGWRARETPVSALLITYNQQQYVRAALESVLNQTYPLDLVISDDASTDDTVGVIRATLAEYRGAHRVRLNVRAQNGGVVANQNDGLALTEGELVVLFEGDDISAPDRVERIVAVYEESGRRVAAIGSSITLIDRDGNVIRQIDWPLRVAGARDVQEGRWQVHGCTLAIRRSCFTEMGPVARGLISADIALWVRAAFSVPGGLAQLTGVPLVKYRVHGENVSTRFSLSFASRAALRESCRVLLPNERAQVEELRTIERYRARMKAVDADADRALRALQREARARARLVTAIAQRSRAAWVGAALSAMRERALRNKAVRVIITAISPAVYQAIKKARGHAPSRSSS